MFCTPSVPQRFLEKIDLSETGCWNWSGCKRSDGYGLAWSIQNKRMERAHRVIFECVNGKIPDAMQLDHRVCRNKGCVNPDHLAVCTAEENREQPDNIIGMKLRQTHCKRGHELSGDNLHIDSNGSRQCRKCRRAREKTARLRGRRK